jgi:hypothetical protein
LTFASATQCWVRHPDCFRRKHCLWRDVNDQIGARRRTLGIIKLAALLPIAGYDIAIHDSSFLARKFLLHCGPNTPICLLFRPPRRNSLCPGLRQGVWRQQMRQPALHSLKQQNITRIKPSPSLLNVTGSADLPKSSPSITAASQVSVFVSALLVFL